MLQRIQVVNTIHSMP